MDRGRQGISEFFLRHRYNYICEALGLHNPSAPYRSMHDCLAVPGDFWKDFHKSPNQKLYEEQDGADSRKDADFEHGLPLTAIDDKKALSSFNSALSNLRAKEAVFRPGQASQIRQSTSHHAVRLGDQKFAQRIADLHDEKSCDDLLLSRQDTVGSPGLDLEARGTAVVVKGVLPGSSASLSSHPIRAGDEVQNYRNIDLIIYANLFCNVHIRTGSETLKANFRTCFPRN